MPRVILCGEQYGRITEPKARLANKRPGTNQLQDPRHYRVGGVQARRHESQGLPSCGPGVMPCSRINWLPIFKCFATWGWMFTFLITAATEYQKVKVGSLPSLLTISKSFRI